MSSGLRHVHSVRALASRALRDDSIFAAQEMTAPLGVVATMFQVFQVKSEVVAVTCCTHLHPTISRDVKRGKHAGCNVSATYIHVSYTDRYVVCVLPTTNRAPSLAFTKTLYIPCPSQPPALFMLLAAAKIFRDTYPSCSSQAHVQYHRETIIPCFPQALY